MPRFSPLLFLLSGFLFSCNLHLPEMVEAEFKHKNDKAFEALTYSLQAESVNIVAQTIRVNDSTHAYLDLTIVNPKAYSEQPNRMGNHMRELAQMLVVDLKNPQDFDAVRVEVQVNNDYLVASTHRNQTVEYTIKELQ